MKHTFGQFLKDKRLALDLSLREFSRKIDMQPSNYCNIESDVLSPPRGEALERISKALGLKRGAPDYQRLHDLAAEARDEIPADVARIVKENELIPAMLRTVEYEKITKAQLRGIIEDLRSGRYKKAGA
jgi:transcriptional regulator with XRE-family HTH domain